jgi:flagellar biosynthetic protein FliR
MSIAIESILPHLPAFAVVLSRLSGLFLFSPLLSSPAIPFQIKAVLLLAMTICVYPTVDHSAMLDVPFELKTLAPVMASELLIGAIIGLLAALPLHALQLSGLLVGQQIGLGMAQLMNPAMDIEGDSLGQMLFMLGLALFIGMGGIELLFGGLVHTFAAVPTGGFGIADAPLDTLVAMLGSGFDLALRLAMPVLAIIFVENAVMGFVMKTMPTLNIMSFGFPIRIILGGITLILCIGAMSGAAIDDLDATMESIESWVGMLAHDEPPPATGDVPAWGW